MLTAAKNLEFSPGERHFAYMQGGSFKLGDCVVEPGHRRVTRGGQVRIIEPKALAVLQRLVAAKGATVSRDELAEAAWNGRFVSDDAINRQMTKLRQLLGDDPRNPRYIETLPKTGFRLLVAAAPISEPAPSPSPATNRFARWGIAVVAVVGVLLWFWQANLPTQPGVSWALQQITATPGEELHPALSPEGRHLAYIARTEGEKFWQLRIRDLRSGEDQVRPVGDADGHAIRPAWSPSGDRIALIKLTAGACELWVLHLVFGQSAPVHTCSEANLGVGLSWQADGQVLLFSDRLDDGQFAIQTIHLSSGQITRVVEPAVATNGDFAPRMHADGRIAFVRQSSIGIEAVFVQQEGVAQRWSEDASDIRDLAWRGDDLLVVTNRGDGFYRVWALDGATQSWSRVNDLPGAHSVSATASTAAVAIVTNRQDIWQLDRASGALRPLIESTRRDFAPAMSPDGARVAWLSDRSGATEVWVAKSDGSQPRQLSRFGGPYTQPPVWAPDGQSLLVSAPVGDHFQLHRVSLDGVTTNMGIAGDSSSAVFDAQGRLHYQRATDDSSDLVDFSGQVVQPDVRRVVMPEDGSLWFYRSRDNQIWRRAPGAEPERFTDAIARIDYRNWWVEQGAVIGVTREGGTAWLSRLEPNEAIDQLHQLPGLVGSSGLASDNDHVLYGRHLESSADLFLLRASGR